MENEATDPPPSPVDWDEMARTGFNPLPVQAIQVETSSICNFRCGSCPLALPDYDRPEKHMSPADLQRVLDAFPEARKIELQGIGEVFLNPQVLDIVRTATARGVEVHTFSNASRIDPDMARGIVESGLHLINFSMDGADEETFRRLRKGGTLARFNECVTNLVAARAELRSSTPTIGIMVVLGKSNYRQVPDMIANAEALGVDTVIFTKMNAVPDPALERHLLGSEERAWLDALDLDGRDVEVVRAYTPWTKTERMECYWPRHMTYVTVEGDITPCCNYYDGQELRLGNVFKQDGDDIWNGEPYRAFRRRLMNGDMPTKCQNC